MQIIIIAVLVLAELIAFAQGATIPNMTSGMKWVGPSNGKNITLFGDATQIMRQLKALDPEWVPANPPSSVSIEERFFLLPVSNTVYMNSSKC